jgi:hypothetical protein
MANLPKANTKAYPWCIVIPTSTGDLVLMRFKTHECAISNLNLYQGFGSGAQQLRIRYKDY